MIKIYTIKNLIYEKNQKLTVKISFLKIIKNLLC